MTGFTPRRAHAHQFVDDTPEFMPDFSLDRHIAEARRERGAEFQREVDEQWDSFPAHNKERVA